MTHHVIRKNYQNLVVKISLFKNFKAKHIYKCKTTSGE